MDLRLCGGLAALSRTVSPSHGATTIATLTRWKTAGAVPITASCAPAKQKMQCMQSERSGSLAGSAGASGCIVQAQFKGRSVLAGICWQGEAGNRDQQALRSNRIGDDYAQNARQKCVPLRPIRSLPAPRGTANHEKSPSKSNVGKKEATGVDSVGEGQSEHGFDYLSRSSGLLI